MRFTLSSTALSSKLIALSRVINSKNSLPILSDFVFEVEGNTLKLTASDSENMIKTSVELNESDEDGSFAIGNHDLLEAVTAAATWPRLSTRTGSSRCLLRAPTNFRRHCRWARAQAR